MVETHRTLLIRADGGPQIGAGHVMRCLALAQGWRRSGGRVIFAFAEPLKRLTQLVEAEGCEAVVLSVAIGSLADADATVSRANENDARWIVADGYAFTAAWQERVHASGKRLLVLDDYGHAVRYFADLILNQNLSADERWYALREPASRLALGPDYVLLRREFLQQRNEPRTIAAEARKILVTFGGSDPDNVTARVIAELREIPRLEATVVIGGFNLHRAALEKLALDCNRSRPWLRLCVNATNMPELMAWADLAITAGGSTLWELAYMRLPSLVLVVANNQAPAAQLIDAAGVARRLHSPEEISLVLPSLIVDVAGRRQMSERAGDLVDGGGVDRVIAQLAEAA